MICDDKVPLGNLERIEGADFARLWRPHRRPRAIAATTPGPEQGAEIGKQQNTSQCVFAKSKTNMVWSLLFPNARSGSSAASRPSP